MICAEEKLADITRVFWPDIEPGGKKASRLIAETLAGYLHRVQALWTTATRRQRVLPECERFAPWSS